MVPKRKRRVLWIFGAVLVLGLLGVGGWFAYEQFLADDESGPSSEVSDTCESARDVVDSANAVAAGPSDTTRELLSADLAEFSEASNRTDREVLENNADEVRNRFSEALYDTTLSDESASETWDEGRAALDKIARECDRLGIFVYEPPDSTTTTPSTRRPIVRQ